MFQPVYLIWFLLPLTLTLLAVYALLKPVFKIAGREYAGDIFLQAVFCWIAFAVAIGLDHSVVVPMLDGIDTTDPMIVVHWLLFPAVLVVLAYSHKVYRSATRRDPREALDYGLARYKR